MFYDRAEKKPKKKQNGGHYSKSIGQESYDCRFFLWQKVEIVSTVCHADGEKNDYFYDERYKNRPVEIN